MPREAGKPFNRHRIPTTRITATVWRFGFFGFFGPLLTIFVFVFLFRALFWGFGGWRRHHMYWNYDPELGQGRFDEWHRRAHERMGGGGTAPSAS